MTARTWSRSLGWRAVLGEENICGMRVYPWPEGAILRGREQTLEAGS